MDPNCSCATDASCS
ncbi:hypothetical protein A6R68_17823 [Neotoma lepida]|uniref:Uncharacterized protein n=1 Tax=Neotoma lepida TaxID=56216 RepID=A0A1A6HCT4_NEOLE|nr:hypothetical protein A6R68_17823 [Neotoma lepida]